MRGLERHSGTAYALLRIMTGFLFLFHGLQKIVGVLTENPQPEMGTQLWFGGMLELIGGTAVMLGLQTRLFAFLCSGMMAVAYFQFHWKFQMDSNFFPIINKGEMAALYCFVFLYIATRGAGKWGIDKS
ncbi:MAG: DoxX family protein [Deltaproteobacteria bacterium]|nr:DoxX family protein [Deltaproteobacteria bacterium]